MDFFISGYHQAYVVVLFLSGNWEERARFFFSLVWNIEYRSHEIPHPDQIERSYVIDHIVIADFPASSHTTFVIQLACSASPVSMRQSLGQMS